jgi:hypothetical protein
MPAGWIFEFRYDGYRAIGRKSPRRNEDALAARQRLLIGACLQTLPDSVLDAVLRHSRGL